jgi:hypothetical protein
MDWFNGARTLMDRAAKLKKLSKKAERFSVCPTNTEEGLPMR